MSKESTFHWIERLKKWFKLSRLKRTKKKTSPDSRIKPEEQETHADKLPGPLPDTNVQSAPIPDLDQDPQKMQLKQEVAKLRSDLDQQQIYQTHLERQNKTLQRVHSEAEAEVARLNNLLRDRDNVGTAQTKHNKADPSVAEEFLTLEDGCSATDIKTLVEALNYDILEVAATTAQKIEEMSKSEDIMMVEEDNCRKPTEWMMRKLGTALCQELKSWDHKEDITLLQLAFQTALCFHTWELIRSWDNLVVENLSPNLTRIYEMMKEKESQSVFARWRALTQRYLDNAFTGMQVRPLATAIIEPILDIILASNVQIRHQKICEILTPFLADKLRIFEPHISRIKETINLEFISGDLTVVYVNSGDPFQSERMSDTFKTAGHGSGVERVVCTVQLGLELRSKIAKGGGFQEESLVLLKPQVFLESSLAELVQKS